MRNIINVKRNRPVLEFIGYWLFWVAVIVGMVVVSVPGHANEWTKEDTYRESAFQTLNIIDWAQTRHIAHNPDKFHEKDYSGLIGSNPTAGRVDAFMALSAVIHFGVAYILPSNMRSIFQYITIGGKLEAVSNNAYIGIKMDF